MGTSHFRPIPIFSHLTPQCPELQINDDEVWPEQMTLMRPRAPRSSEPIRTFLRVSYFQASYQTAISMSIFCLAALLVTQHPQRKGLYEGDSRN